MSSSRFLASRLSSIEMIATGGVRDAQSMTAPCSVKTQGAYRCPELVPEEVRPLVGKDLPNNPQVARMFEKQNSVVPVH